MTTQRAPSNDGMDVAAVLDQRARALARPPDAAATQDGALHVVVRVGPHRIAIPASKARQCSAAQPIATLAVGGGRKLLGIVPTSDGVVAVADLAELLDVTADVPMAQRPMVVVDDGDEGLALLVDELDRLIDVDTASDRPDADALTTAGPEPGIRILGVDALLDAVAHRPQTPRPPGALQ